MIYCSLYFCLEKIELERLTSLQVKDKLWGVAELDGRIYVLCGSRTVVVYDGSTFERLTEAEVRDKSLDAFDIAACTINHCLYVLDGNKRDVWRLKNEQSQPDLWLRTEVDSFSVTPNGHVLLLSNSEPASLSIHGPDANLLETVKLPNELKEPQHAVETRDGNFIVSHGGYQLKESTCNSQHRVCEMTRDGTVIRSYGGVKGGGSGELNNPVRVAIDAEGRVFIADWGNDRVLVVDSSLTTCTTLLTKDQDDVYCPRRLFYSVDSHRLFVGERRDHVTVYDVTSAVAAAATHRFNRTQKTSIEK